MSRDEEFCHPYLKRKKKKTVQETQYTVDLWDIDVFLMKHFCSIKNRAPSTEPFLRLFRSYIPSAAVETEND